MRRSYWRTRGLRPWTPRDLVSPNPVYYPAQRWESAFNIEIDGELLNIMYVIWVIIHEITYNIPFYSHGILEFDL